MRRLSRARWVFLYYLSWVVFGLVGLLLNLGCSLLLVLPSRETYGPAVRSTIRRLFQGWLAWHHASGVIAVDWVGFEEGALAPGAVYIANHPTLIDATFILARLPDALCIFKPSLMRNPAIGPAALMAGYEQYVTERGAAGRLVNAQNRHCCNRCPSRPQPWPQHRRDSLPT